MTYRICENCDFFKYAGYISQYHGECHRYPPNFLDTREKGRGSTSEWYFPIVSTKEFCGEYKKRRSK